MTNIMTFSGWGMAHDALANVTPEGSHHVDYSNFTSAQELFKSLKGQSPDVLVGWSLGGQLALRAISDGILAPKKLILLATPYQFVANKEVKCAMDKDTFSIFVRDLGRAPEMTLKRFITLISLNDANAYDIITKLKQTTSMENSKKWFYWLEELENFSCNSIDFSIIPTTYAIHGRDDTIVDSTQTGLFKSLIADLHLEIFDHCGHAPHLHDEARVKAIIQSAL